MTYHAYMTDLEKSELLNVCIIPSLEVSATCVELSNTLKSPDTLLTLDGITKFAHMTVFMARFPIQSQQKVIDAVSNVLKDALPFACTHTGFHTTEGGYGEVSYDKSSEMLALHGKIIDAVKEFRFNPGDPFVENFFGAYSDEQKQSAEQTGYDLTYDLYRPHVTLTRYSPGTKPSEEIFAAMMNETKTNLSFTANKICVYKADDNGAIFKELASFNV